MNINRGILAAFLVVGLGAASFSLLAADPQKADTIVCADCHDEAKAFARNPHAHQPALAKKGITGDAICSACHGETADHVASAGDKPVARQMRDAGGPSFCLTCHDATTDHRSFRNSVHANSAAVNCLSCHSIHGSDPRMPRLLAKETVALCASCHPVQAASFHDKPFAHRLEGGMTCVSCHDPHGKRTESALRRTRADELPCVSCHAEKRGPFVFNHAAGVAGDCMTCHQPHGSVNPKQLIRSQVSQLCLECHSTLTSTTLGSQPPAFHNIHIPRYQNCTSCHVAVHGSNRSPVLLK